ncbi:transposase [Marinitoga aeolica]|uniref:Transposase n=1 Tax=Marinitoga aeolica TaxID=2809031 RepID=A0ABY8PP54_9BACT|nr:transposase [Marinitoga aeolica]WGS64359.1 transposase [Marinitoga aeolica]WGS64414.1 transposase [Marinitoga aeolica]WGS64661.1 transposase [Marinitoga aeolica]WGS65474.1 transposase [Marinitoga aeolica]
MKNRNKYSPDFKLQVVKEYLNSDKSLSDIASKNGIPSPHTLHKWVKKYEDSGYDDNIFNSKKGRPKSIISDISKVPPFIYESAGIVKPDNNSNDTNSLKKKIEYYERLLIEKELLIKMQEDEINFLKKKHNWKK